ncbi:MAG: hypothetical protein RL127_464 [Bacteroidota bacterium]
MYNRKNLWRKYPLIGILLVGLPLATLAQSILKQGTWHRIAIAQSGFYRIDQSWLSKHLISGDPRKFGLYSSPSGMLPQDPANATAFNLTPIPIAIEGEANGQWDAGDQLLFWGDSPHKLTYDVKTLTWNQETHAYSDSSYYFLRTDDPNPLRLNSLEPTKGTGNPLNFAQTLSRYEPEKYNLIQSGRTWLGDAFYGSGNLALQYALKDAVIDQKVNLKARFYSGGIAPGKFTINIPGNSPIPLEIPAISGNRYDQKAFSKDLNQTIELGSSADQWNWSINYQSTSGTGYLDYVQLTYSRKFNPENDLPLYLFSNTRDTTVNLQIPNLPSSSIIWLKNGENLWQQLKKTGPEMEIRISPGSRLAIGNSSKALHPIYVSRVANQDILDQDPQLKLIIITSPLLMSAGSKLAKFKTSIQKIPSQVVTTKQIYQEFSGGKQDVSAIRNYLKALSRQTDLRYVILLGDASIDYKGKSTVASALEKNCYVPTYQSLESMEPLLSYSSDDYFGIIDANAGDWEITQPNMQLAVGRIPAKNPDEANMFVQKLMDYQSKPSPSVTRPFRFSWVADDGDFSIHMQDAEDFSTSLQNGNFAFDYQKTYLDQYPMETANGQFTSAAAKKQVLALFSQEADFIHFVGHGSESGWTDEKILTNNDLVGLRNSNHLPILLTATCQFGRFDDPNQLSGGEIALLSPQGGAIALMSTTRPVFQSSNYAFGKAFYNYLLTHVQASSYRLGDLFKDAKNASKTGVINRNLSLLGDPSSPLPWQTNGVNISPTGANWLAKTDNQEDGQATAFYYAENSAAKTLGTKGNAFTYVVPGELIGKSAHSVKQGIATITSNNIPVSGKNLELKLVGQTKSGKSVSGYQVVQKKSDDLVDTQPPKIQISFPDELNLNSFSANPSIVTRISDDQGLRWKGPQNENSYLTLNDTLQIPILAFWEPEVDTPNQGSLRYTFPKLKAGNYKVRVNCWDINNNASAQSFTFTVGDSPEANVPWKLYPNPAQLMMTYRMPYSRVWSSDRYELTMYNLLGERVYNQTGDLNQVTSQEAGFEFPVDKLGAGTMGFVWIKIIDNEGKIIETVKSKILTLK